MIQKVGGNVLFLFSPGESVCGIATECGPADTHFHRSAFEDFSACLFPVRGIWICKITRLISQIHPGRLQARFSRLNHSGSDNRVDSIKLVRCISAKPNDTLRLFGVNLPFPSCENVVLMAC